MVSGIPYAFAALRKRRAGLRIGLIGRTLLGLSS